MRFLLQPAPLPEARAVVMPKLIASDVNKKTTAVTVTVVFSVAQAATR